MKNRFLIFAFEYREANGGMHDVIARFNLEQVKMFIELIKQYKKYTKEMFRFEVVEVVLAIQEYISKGFRIDNTFNKDEIKIIKYFETLNCFKIVKQFSTNEFFKISDNFQIYDRKKDKTINIPQKEYT